MNYSKTTLLAGFLLLTTSLAFCQKDYALKSYTMSIDGTSSLHDWTSEVTKVEWAGQLTTEGTSLKTIQNVVVTIAVESIKSEKGGMMDDKTYEAFKYKENPSIIFKLTTATVTGNNIKAKGSLTMAGVTKPIDMNVAAKVLDDQSVHLSGSHKINMKDFKMTPPKAVMGTIKVGEKVTFLFEMIVTP